MNTSKQILDYWNRRDIESMYDKYLLNLEIQLIRKRIPADSKILDAGCGEGEGTIVYSEIPNSIVHAADFSSTRLEMAKKRLAHGSNVFLFHVDFLGTYKLDFDYDVIISQRFFINLMKWELQQKVMSDLMNHLKCGGLFLILEGSIDGVNELNKVRELFKLQPIPVKWHNHFFVDKQLETFLDSKNFEIVEKVGMGEYFFLTRAIRPFFEKDLNWNTEFNRISSSINVRSILKIRDRFSRLKLWVAKKC